MPHIDTELGLVRTIPREVKMPEGYRVLLDIWSHKNEYQENIKQLIRTPEISKNAIKEAILWIRWEETKNFREPT